MEETDFQPRWKIWQSFLSCAGILALMFGISFLVEKFSAGLNWNPFMIIFATALIQAGLLIGVPFYIAVHLYGHHAADLGFVGSGFQSAFREGVKWGVILFFFVTLIGILVTVYYPGVPEPQDFARLVMMVDSFWKLALVVIMGVILAPLGEEIFFRGFLYPALRSRWGAGIGILLTALFFAALHFDLYRLLPIAVGGAGLTYLYERTGNIWTNIIAHAVWNGMMIGILVSSKIAAGG